MSTEYQHMSISDYDEVIALWTSTEGIGLSDADSRENIDMYLQRNPGLSFVARHDGEIVGAVLCGHDGRRGCIYHLAVASSFRGHGIGKTLTGMCLAGLGTAGIHKCNIFVFGANIEGEAFWNAIGWISRSDLMVMQKPIGT